VNVSDVSAPYSDPIDSLPMTDPTRTAPISTEKALTFLPGVAEKLGWYVSALRDPLNQNVIFYVGKGKGNRVYQHAVEALKLDDQPSENQKLETIQAIHDANLEVGIEIVRHQIPSESTAYEVEAAVLDALLLVGVKPANIQSGHGRGRGWQPLQETVATYKADAVEIASDHRVVLIRINRLFHHAMTANELYEATRQWWVMAPHSRKPDFAFSVYHGIVRAVYRIRPQDWEQRDNDKRWAFHGEVDEKMERLYVWRDVSKYLPQGRGGINPITYVYC
jgi:uncharacterized protein